MTEKVASFALNLEGDAKEVSKETTAELEKLRASIESSQEKVRGYGAALKSLRGSTEEVTAAKEQLKAKIEGERGAISQANLALLKQGVTYEKLAGEIRKADAAQKKLDAKKQAEALKQLAASQHKLTDGIKAAGGPVATLTEHFTKLKELVGGTGGSMAVLGAGVGIAVGAVVGLTVAIVAAAAKLGSFIVESADAMRTLGLMRESMTGSAQSGKALGTWVDWMGHRVALSREQLTDLALQMDKTFSPARTTVNPKKLGQVTQLAFYSASRALAGMGKYGDEAASKITGLIERGKVFGRTRVTPEDLEGTGLKFAELAAGYAKIKGVSLDRARQELQGYSADVLDVARAFNAATDTRWAKTNAEGLLGLTVQWEKFKERLVSLAGSGILEPLLKGLSRLAYQFDPASESGKRLQKTFEKIGTAIGSINLDKLGASIASGIDWVNEFVDAMGDVKTTLDTIGKSPAVGLMVTGFKVLGYTVLAIGGVVLVTLAGIGLAFGLLWEAGELLGEGIYELYSEITGLAWGKIPGILAEPFVSAWHWVTGIKWGELGTSIINGIVNGITGGATKVWNAITGIADRVKSTFKGLLGIASPSKVFQGYGAATASGYARGVDQGAPRAQRAVDAMAPAPPANATATASGAASAGAAPFVMHVEFHAGPGASGQEFVRQVKESGFLGDLQKTLRRVLVSQGIPTQAVVET